jgi:hypothetical protein
MGSPAMLLNSYIYEPLKNSTEDIRLLKLNFDIRQSLGRANSNPITGKLKNYSLPLTVLPRSQRLLRAAQLPSFNALSYVWGNPARTHEVIIDGKRLGITENLYKALRDVQKDAIGVEYIWADAICICQDDLAERSAQIPLMREVYHAASYVLIWLGTPTEDGRRGLKFIADLTGALGPEESAMAPTEEDELEEKITKAILLPAGAFANGLVSFGQTIIQIADIIESDVRDDKAQMLLDSDTALSLHHDIIQDLIEWKPKSRHWKTVQGEDFASIANLIDQALIQNEPWFERMWVVQELGASESTTILGYGKSIRWDQFLRAIYFLHYSLRAPVNNIRKLTGLEKIRQSYYAGKRQPLRDLIRECRYRKATDPRDKIFSLLGMMGDSKSAFLTPDYTKSVSEVYANAAFHFIQQSGSLDPLCGWQTLGRQEQLPSWTPDYYLNQDLADAPLVSIDGRDSIFSASGHDYRSKFTAMNPEELKDSWTHLPTNGLLIDTIVTLSEPLPEDALLGSIEHMWNSTVSSMGRLLEGFTKDVELSLEDISSVVSKYSEYWSSLDQAAKHLRSPSLASTSSFFKSTEFLAKHSRSTDQLPKAGSLSQKEPLYFEPIEPDPFIHEIYILDAYIQSLFCGRISTTERLTKDDIQKFMALSLPADTVDPERESYLGKVCTALEAGMARRSVAVTKKGYIGAIPQQAQPGDLICTLFGCSVPVVLRKRIGEEYLFIGECYLHGFMDSEAIVHQIKGEFPVQKFVLS